MADPETTASDAPESGAAPVAEPPVDDSGVAQEFADAWDEAEQAEASGEPAPAASGEPDDPPDPAPEAGSGEETQAAREGGGQGGEARTAGAAEAGNGEAARDIWADAPDELKSAFEAERRRADAAEHGRKSAEGRQAATQRRLDTVMAGERPEGDPPEGGEPARRSTQPTQEQVNGFRENWKKFTDEYPEIAEPLAPLLSMLEDRNNALEGEIQRLRAGQETMAGERLAATSDAIETAVRAEHPDFDAVLESQEFADWYEAQPAFIQSAVQENGQELRDQATVLHILGSFKRDTGFGGGAPANGSGAGTNGSGERHDADPVERIRLRSATGQPPPSPGARTLENPTPRTGSFDDEWARADEAERRTRGEAHLA